MALAGRRIANRPPTTDMFTMSSVGIRENAVSPISPFSRKTTLTAMMNTTAARLAATPTMASRGDREATGTRSLVTGWLFMGNARKIGSGSRSASKSLRNMEHEHPEIVTAAWATGWAPGRRSPSVATSSSRRRRASHGSRPPIR